MAVQASAIIESVKFLAHENRSFCDTDTDSSNREQNRARKESSRFVRASLFYKTIELIQKGHRFPRVFVSRSHSRLIFSIISPTNCVFMFPAPRQRFSFSYISAIYFCWL